MTNFPPNADLVALGIEEDPNNPLCKNCDQYLSHCDCNPELSECCGAGTYGDYRICEDCKEHCGEVEEKITKTFPNMGWLTKLFI